MKNNKKTLHRGIENLYLGRDIGGLISEIEDNLDNDVFLVKKILTKSIISNPFQPRKYFNEKSLKELENSIQSVGLISPIIVIFSNSENKYIIVAGERRFRAHQNLGITTIDCIILEKYNEEKLINISLVENNQREDLSPIEEAKAIRKGIQFLGLTHEDFAKKIGKPRSYVTHSLRLLSLPEATQDLIEKGKITVSHGKLLSSQAYETVSKITEDMQKNTMSVRKLNEVLTSKSDSSIKYDEYCSKLAEIACTKVEIDKNKINIYYHGEENLKNILKILGVK